MKYYGIQTPKQGHQDSYIYWITHSSHESWMLFFQISGNPIKFTISEAIKAYKSIGYKCIELHVTIVNNDNNN